MSYLPESKRFATWWNKSNPTTYILGGKFVNQEIKKERIKAEEEVKGEDSDSKPWNSEPETIYSSQLDSNECEDGPKR